MKRTLSLLLALMLSTAVFAQNRGSIFVSESFDSSSVPSGWEVDGEGAANIILNQSNYAGGQPNEVAVAGGLQKGFSSFNGYARLITPSCDMTGVNEILFSFKHIYETYVSFKLGFAVSDDNCATWTDLWSQNFNNYDVGEIRQTKALPEGINKSSLRFCVYVYGNADNMNLWCFDDITIMTQDENDVTISEINVPDFVSLGENEVSFSVKNIGSKTVTSLVATYELDGQEPVTENFSGYIAPFATKQFTFTTPMTISSFEEQFLIVTVDAINNAEDNNPSNNNAGKALSISMGEAQRIPMIEHFSSSSCPPCVGVNASMKTLTENNHGKYTYVKYSTNWPSPTDSHYIAESNTRVQYYQVDGVPFIVIDGMDKGTPINQSILDSRYNAPAVVDIRGAFNIDGDNINVTADFLSYCDIDNVKAFVTINEKVIEKNGANGEREFRHILLKMLGGAQGTAVKLTAGVPERLTFTHNMTSTKMQDINDLEVAIWLQNLTTGEVFNSRHAYEYTDHCYPVQNLTLTENGANVDITWQAPEQGTPTGYNVYNNTVLVAENTTDLSLSVEKGDFNIVSVVALYEDDKTSVPVVKGVGSGLDIEEVEQMENTFSIYPNPAKDYVRVAGEDINTISIYNCLGALVERIEADGNTTMISISNYNTGIYFVNIEQNNGVSTTKKMVVTH